MVEMLVTMAIVAIIIAIGANGLVEQQKKARDARRKADLQEIRAALEQARTRDGWYTSQDNRVSQLSLIEDFFDDDVIPNDPKSNYEYLIEFGNCDLPLNPTHCGTYTIGAVTESNPPSNCMSGACDGATDGTCTYCVTQP